MVSTNSSGNQGNNESNLPSISTDGRYVAFSSQASNLVPGDTNGTWDVFIKDTQTGATTLVSADSAGAQANCASDSPSLSANGRYIAFTSCADNLVSDDTNTNHDIFVKDTLSGISTRVSTDSAGAQVYGINITPCISGDGRYVAFGSNASGLVPGGNQGLFDVYVKDTQTGATTVASTDSSGGRANRGSSYHSISLDGRYVAFASSANNLVPGDSENKCTELIIGHETRSTHCMEIFLKDRQTGQTVRVSNNSSGGQPGSGSGFTAISDGSRVAYLSMPPFCYPCDPGIFVTNDLIVWDKNTGATSRVSIDAAGNNQENGHSWYPAISADNQYIAFESDATNLVPGDTNRKRDVFLQSASPVITTRSAYWPWYDGVGSQNWLLMANPAGSPYNQSFDLSIANQTADLSPFALTGLACPSGQCSPGQVPPAMAITPIYTGLMGGPVVATARPGDKPLLASQRILWGDSLEEVPGMDENKLSDHYYWPWYDQLSAGMTDWVVVANPSSTETVHATLSFINQDDTASVNAEYDILPGESWTPTFPGKMGGPVEVKAYLAGAGHSWPTDKRNVITSQRVLSNNGAALNEVPGTPAGDLSDHYLWTWYDQSSPGSQDWILIANPASAAASVYYEIYVAGQLKEQDNYGGSPDTPIPPGGMVAPQFYGVIGGPVEVKTYADQAHSVAASSIASQRSLWGPSFEEVPGYRYSSLATDYHWPWYDMQSAGAINWVMLANPNPGPVDYSIKVGGSEVGSGTLQAAGAPGDADKATPTFPGTMGGPVEVTSTGGTVITSQRVLWNGYFNEVLGTVLN